MRPSRHNTGEGDGLWWDFNVSSVALEGHRKNHMAGSVSINTCRQRPAAKKMPNLPQRASGKLWNDALKQVGFNYGPTFQDMDNIIFHGKSYCAHATTHIKTEVMDAESRYVLHPAILDSCLELMIVAIWAGRAGAMQFGAVPVQAEEIVIWRPTQAQLADGAATAFSWIDPRGQRLFNAHNQLLAGDGQVLMEISSMRCTAYETAIPQRLEEPTQPQPYGRFVLKPDVSLLTGTQQNLDIADFVEPAEFKAPGIRVLTVDAGAAAPLLAKVPEPHLKVAHSLTGGVDAMKAEFSGFKNTKLLMPFDLSIALDEQSVKSHSYDLVVARVASPDALQRISELLAEGGRAILELCLPLPETTL
ncbi:hypothetical protein DL771_008976 [Monosporascus sp. 5C6A]|nr:hypothetical protein DL771_008976 [Monosporascus sp. 5C6A]